MKEKEEYKNKWPLIYKGVSSIGWKHSSSYIEIGQFRRVNYIRRGDDFWVTLSVLFNLLGKIFKAHCKKCDLLKKCQIQNSNNG